MLRCWGGGIVPRRFNEDHSRFAIYDFGCMSSDLKYKPSSAMNWARRRKGSDSHSIARTIVLVLRGFVKPDSGFLRKR